MDHVLVRLIRGVDSSLSSLDRQSKGIHDDQRVPHDLPLHEAHNFVRNTRPRVYNLKNTINSVLTDGLLATHHLDNRHGGYFTYLEVMWTVLARQNYTKYLRWRKAHTPVPKEPLC